VAGIEPASAGFHRVRIAPNLGTLGRITATMPHPRGEIRVDLAHGEGRLAGEVDLPPGTPGEFEWAGHRQELAPGVNRIALEDR
jgi:alpha-L-rhamnosidase